jgi:DNA repair protein RecO (recombination protein O)
MGDLLIDFSPPHQANDTLFRMVIACVDAIAQTPGDLQAVVRYFELWLLKIEGFLPDLRCCAECHRAFNDDEAVFMAFDQALRCRSCSGGKGMVISKALHAHLRSSEKLPPTRFAEEAREVPSQTRRELGELTHQLIGRVLERQPRVRLTPVDKWEGIKNNFNFRRFLVPRYVIGAALPYVLLPLMLTAVLLRSSRAPPKPFSTRITSFFAKLAPP